jgi:hypothetical protein
LGHIAQINQAGLRADRRIKRFEMARIATTFAWGDLAQGAQTQYRHIETNTVTFGSK